MSKPSRRVTRHARAFERAIRDTGADELELAVLLALAATESSGDPHADNGTFRGVLQIGGPYLTDARGWLAKHRPELLDEVPEHKDGLLGDVRASALVVCAYMRRYRHRHGWEPYRIAAIHKGGAGTGKTLTGLLNDGVELREALLRTEAIRKVPRLERYVLSRNHFHGHYPVYRSWAEERERPARALGGLLGRAVRGLAQWLQK